jgi:hypothetical protein
MKKSFPRIAREAQLQVGAKLFGKRNELPMKHRCGDWGILHLKRERYDLSAYDPDQR